LSLREGYFLALGSRKYFLIPGKEKNIPSQTRRNFRILKDSMKIPLHPLPLNKSLIT
jgi:hypothetical protein